MTKEDLITLLNTLPAGAEVLINRPDYMGVDLNARDIKAVPGTVTSSKADDRGYQITEQVNAYRLVGADTTVPYAGPSSKIVIPISARDFNWTDPEVQALVLKMYTRAKPMPPARELP